MVRLAQGQLGRLGCSTPIYPMIGIPGQLDQDTQINSEFRPWQRGATI